MLQWRMRASNVFCAICAIRNALRSNIEEKQRFEAEQQTLDAVDGDFWFFFVNLRS